MAALWFCYAARVMFINIMFDILRRNWYKNLDKTLQLKPDKQVFETNSNDF